MDSWDADLSRPYHEYSAYYSNDEENETVHSHGHDPNAYVSSYGYYEPGYSHHSYGSYYNEAVADGEQAKDAAAPNTEDKDGVVVHHHTVDHEYHDGHNVETLDAHHHSGEYHEVI